MMCVILCLLCFFFFNDTATTEIYTLSLHDALPIYIAAVRLEGARHEVLEGAADELAVGVLAEQLRQLVRRHPRSEEHTSELQSRQYLVCRLLLEKKKNKNLCLPSATHRDHSSSSLY